MTYIEFFDKVSSENISACLTYVPDRVIYIGDNSKLMKKHIANYDRVFKDRGYSIEFSCKAVSKSNLGNAVEILSELVNTYDDCVFDITGGDEILNLALGIVYAQNADKNIQIHRFNLRNNVLYDCDKDGNTVYKDAPRLTVEENVRIYGGDIVYGGVREEQTYLWELSDEFVNDVNLIWSLCRGDSRLWNTQIGVFEAAEAVGSVSEDGLTTIAEVTLLNAYLYKRKASYKLIKGIVAYLSKHGLMKAYEDRGKLVITYKNSQVKRCLTKAGQALEMKVYTIAKGLLADDGAPIYNDAMNGVVIDWDGEFHDEETERVYDTENEIDILLMHDVVPVFISCKNGAVSSDELYKVNTVAERFGGKYAKKVLFTASISFLGEAGDYLRQRAVDMNIRLIENVQDLNDSELASRIKSLWKN